jgi:hypothetical protein
MAALFSELTQGSLGFEEVYNQGFSSASMVSPLVSIEDVGLFAK